MDTRESSEEQDESFSVWNEDAGWGADLSSTVLEQKKKKKKKQ